MRRDDTLDPENLNRPDWNSLKSNYDKHDIAEAYFIGCVNQLGLEAEAWGIDMRHDDEAMTFDDRMDLRLWEPLLDSGTPLAWPSDVPHDQWLAEANPEWWYVDEADGHKHFNCQGGTRAWRLRSIVDVKSKANTDWMGILNLRHLAHYAAHADTYDVPVCLYFTMVDMDAESVGEENTIVQVPTEWPYERVNEHFETEGGYEEWPDLKALAAECSIVDRTFQAPDGNAVVDTTDDSHRDFEWFETQLS
jgi:hypothetical protein